jgi:hypothetical protein
LIGEELLRRSILKSGAWLDDLMKVYTNFCLGLKCAVDEIFEKYLEKTKF